VTHETSGPAKRGRKRKQPVHREVALAAKAAVGAQIAFLDIETAPMESYHWALWKQNIGLKMIRTHFSILSFSVSWLGDDRVKHFNTGGKGIDKVRDDRYLCEVLWHILDKADIVVVQNGKSFDIPKINTRMLIHGMPPYSPVKIVDTKLIAKKHFGFASNSLAYMTDLLCTTKKRDHAKFPGFDLWAEMLKDNPEAWAECELYNDDDVLSMKELYLKFRPWVEGHPNVANYNDREKPACPKCGSHHVEKRGFSRTQTGEYQRYQCQDCGGWSRSRYTLNTTGKRKALLSN
jgi:uncharacterized protein YprB with RNaseH-like and TPR domain/predicted RNA-binding Zn-ribbon protein involved in translation (DUF1610 family)